MRNSRIIFAAFTIAWLLGNPAMSETIHIEAPATITIEVTKPEPPPPPPVFQPVDYTIGGQLAGVAQRGEVIYHLELLRGYEYHLKRAIEQLESVPDGTSVMIDWEPWITGEAKWYGHGDRESNRRMYERYTRFLGDIRPVVERKRLTISIYGCPVLMQRNWSSVWYDYDHASGNRGEWEIDQTRAIVEAEEAGFLPLLREMGGHVLVVAYMHPQWDDRPKWHDAVARTIRNMDAKLDAYHVPHRWLARPDLNGKPLGDEFRRLFIERGCDWWAPKEAAGIHELIKEFGEVSR